MNRIQELRARREAQAREANTLRETSDRTPEQNTRYSELLDEIVRIDEEIEREERFLDSERRDAEFMRRNGGGHNGAPAAGGDGGSGAGQGSPAGGANRNVVNGMELRTIPGFLAEIGEDGRRARGDVAVYSDPAARAWFQELRSRSVGNSEFNFEGRAFSAGTPEEGGFLSRGEQFVARLIAAVDDQTFIRQNATVVPIADGFSSAGMPALETDAEDADWTSELGTGNEEDSLRFSKRTLTPHPLAKRVKISRELLRAAALDAEAIILSRIAYKFGITQEKGFLTGSGAGEPLGLFTASADGISTGRDMSTGNSTTAIATDGLIENKYNVKSQYWARARWLFHRTAVKNIAKLKDGDGQYIWQPSLIAGQPDLLLSHPLMVSEYAPSTFTTGLYVGLFGDLSFYWIADSLSMTMQRLVELYAATNQIGFIGRLQTDGMPVLEEAFSRVKLA